MGVALITKVLPYVDELFTKESKKQLISNQDYKWDGAQTVKIYKISTADMNDYGRSGPSGSNWSRYGEVESLDATLETMTLTRDRSFTFVLDTMDVDETERALQAGTALARQQREVIIPEIDAYVIAQMVAGAGTVGDDTTNSAAAIYEKILEGTRVLDNALVPEEGRVLIISNDAYMMLKKSDDVVLNTEVGQDMRIRGVIGNLDGMTVIKMPASRLPVDFGFMIAHPSACVAPVKLAEYVTHHNPPGISGDLVEGRVVYDAFVLNNKAKAIYYQPANYLGALTVASAAGSSSGKTALTVSPAKGGSNSYKYKVAAAETNVTYQMDVSSWTSWDGSADITAASGKIITLVEADTNGKAVKAGHVTVVSAT